MYGTSTPIPRAVVANTTLMLKSSTLISFKTALFIGVV